ncbi:hypothetical protein CY35_06G119400 [Sphagnum magellanicum]|nr:hypothetical protein CY35_06G119400 [Sphagnum magellanicum]
MDGIFDADKVGIIRFLMVFMVLLFFFLNEEKSAFQWKKWCHRYKEDLVG